jgi:hypothetical protein
MARQWKPITQFRAWPNDKGAAKYGNSKWTPYKDGAPADVHLRHDVQYSVRVYENDDGSITLKVEQPVEYTGTDSVADDVSQGGFRQVAEAAGVQETARKSKMSLDDDIPF